MCSTGHAHDGAFGFLVDTLEIRALNDAFFGSLDAKVFAGLSKAMAALADGSAQVARRLHDLKTTAQTARRAVA